MESLSIPNIIPAMVLRDTVFYPQSILPLFIFEPKYREMLADVLGAHRMFTVVPENLELSATTLNTSDLHDCVTMGCIHACQTYEDGTSVVLLEGICRLTVKEIIHDKPYLQLKVGELQNSSQDPLLLEILMQETLQLMEKINKCGGRITKKTLDHLRQIEAPQHFVDHAAVSFLSDTQQTQNLLSCPDTRQRYCTLMQLLKTHFQTIETLNRAENGTKYDEWHRN